jgi:hypothetical protein
MFNEGVVFNLGSAPEIGVQIFIGVDQGHEGSFDEVTLGFGGSLGRSVDVVDTGEL